MNYEVQRTCKPSTSPKLNLLPVILAVQFPQGDFVNNKVQSLRNTHIGVFSDVQLLLHCQFLNKLHTSIHIFHSALDFQVFAQVWGPYVFIYVVPFNFSLMGNFNCKDDR